MSENECFLICFNSQGNNIVSDNTTIAGRCNLLFNVNWGAFLPKKYKKFKCQFTFTSVIATAPAVLTEVGFVNISTGRMNVYNGLSMTNNIGIIYPYYIGANSLYNSTNNENNTFWMDYPLNTQVLVSLKTFTNVDMPDMPHYCLYLSLVGILDDEIDKSN